MATRAECVMLNKGPHIETAVGVLDDVLHRMATHQHEKISLLRSRKPAHRPRRDVRPYRSRGWRGDAPSIGLRCGSRVEEPVAQVLPTR
jgi:pyruvate kinase